MITTVFIFVVGVYRLTLHPLAGIPGPRLAAVSNIWYARRIASGRLARLGVELHAKYGDVVRVGPNEVWFNTREAFDQIYGMRQPRLPIMQERWLTRSLQPWEKVSKSPTFIVSPCIDRCTMPSPLTDISGHGFDSTFRQLATRGSLSGLARPAI